MGLPWTNVYGVARTLLALATLLTLAYNPSNVLFLEGPQCGFPLSAFCILPASHFEVSRWGSVLLLAVVASGWRPRVTGLLHWWISASFFMSASVVDGGDHVTGVLTLILIPLTITDPRPWHWQKLPRWRLTPSIVVGWSSLVVVRVQMAGLYLHAFVAKTGVEEWVDGTALYYWFNDNDFGLPGLMRVVAEPFLSNWAVVSAITWGSLLVEIVLFLGLAVSPRVRVWLFGLGVMFHGLIAVCMGLWSFSLAMVGALVLYLLPASSVNCLALGPGWFLARKARDNG